MANAILILLVTAGVTLAIHIVLRRHSKRKPGARHVWRHALHGALNAPLQAVIWMIGLSIAEATLTTGQRLQLLGEVSPPFRDVVVVAIAAWFLFRFVERAQASLVARAAQQGKEYDVTATDAIGKLVRAVIVIAAALVMTQSLGYSIASLLAFGGVAGIAVGFAAQSLVANLLGGFTVYASRPFKVGEYIVFPGTELMGLVEHIGWRATRVMGFDKRPFYVPNAKFNTETIINFSRMTNRRIMEYVYVRLGDIAKVPAIVADANRLLGEHPEIDHSFFVFHFDSYGDHALKLFLYAFTTSTAYVDYMRVKEDALLKVAAIVARHGAKLARPASNVYVPEGLSIQREYAQRATEPGAAGTAFRQRHCPG